MHSIWKPFLETISRQTMRGVPKGLSDSDLTHRAYAHDADQQTYITTPGSLQGEYRAGGHVSTRPAGLLHPWGAIT